jgi:peptide/nickel transport system substrate-binding protein
MRTEKRPSSHRFTGVRKIVLGTGILNRKFLILLAALGLIILLVACASTPSAVPSSTVSPATSTPPKSSLPAASTAPPPAPSTPAANKYGGTLRINWATQVGQFGYPPNLKGPAHNFAKPCLEGLLRRSNELGVYLPLLAESWTLAPDKSSYTFNLRKGVKFHDGTDFNAAAVKWNLDKILTGTQTLLQNVKSLEIVDDYTIKANLKDWDILVLDDFVEPTCFIYSPTAFDKNGMAWADTHPIGTGAFVFKEFVERQYYKYEKNQNYWNKSLPYLDAVQINYIQDPMTAKLSMLNGDLDMMREVDVDSAIELVGSGKVTEEHLPVGHFKIGRASCRERV